MMFPAASDMKLPGLLSFDSEDVANMLLALAREPGAPLGFWQANGLWSCITCQSEHAMTASFASPAGRCDLQSDTSPGILPCVS